MKITLKRAILKVADSGENLIIDNPKNSDSERVIMLKHSLKP